MARTTSSASLPFFPSVEATASRAPGRLSARAAFALQASMAISFLAGSSAPTPIYGLYQAAWGFSPITVTVVFGVYAIAVLSTLVTVGALSDQIGRRPVLLAAVAMQAVAMLIFATAGDVSALVLARVVQGLSTGAAAAAIGAAMLDLDRARGTIANSVAPMLGTAIGGIASGLMVQFLPAPTHLVYLILFVVFVAQAIGVLLMPETVTARRALTRSAFRPQLRVPPVARQALLLAIPVLVATWALPGFYGSLGPALVRSLVGSRAPALGGLTLFLMAASGAGAVLLMRARTGALMLTIGAGALFAGVGLTLVGMASGSNVTFFAGTAVAGIGFGAGFQGALRTLVPLVAPAERAGILSVVYIVSYLAMGVPAVVAGWGVVHGGGLRTTAQQYGVAIMILAALALLGRLAQSVAAARRRVA